MLIVMLAASLGGAVGAPGGTCLPWAIGVWGSMSMPIERKPASISEPDACSASRTPCCCGSGQTPGNDSDEAKFRKPTGLRAVAGENATGVAGKASPEGEDVWSVFGQGSRADEDARHFVELGVGVLGVAA
jgi:hypothetical protein